MNKIFYLIFILISQSIYSQSTIELDKANGFKTFKLESAFALHSKYLKYSSTEEGIKEYNHINPESITFLKKNPEVASFSFYNNKLYDILLFFRDYELMSYKRIIDELTILFGEPTENRKTLTGNLWITWEGKNVSLMTQYFYEGDTFCIEFKSKNIKRKILQKKF